MNSIQDLLAFFDKLEREEEGLSIDPVEDDKTGWTGWQCLVGNSVYAGKTPAAAFLLAVKRWMEVR